VAHDHSLSIGPGVVTGPCRSALFLPAANARAIAKARTLPCDVVILDLEDAVAPDAKAEARAMALAAVAEGGWGGRRLVIRVNGLDTPFGEADCVALRGVPVNAVLVPKLSSAPELAQWYTVLGDAPLWAMIETCGAMLRLAEIAEAAADHRLECLVAGTNDLAKEMRCTPGVERTPLIGHLAMIVTAARAAGIAVLDGVCNAIDDPERLERECAQGAALGFDGKTLIHPAQIDTANRAFAPSEARVAWAQAVVAAFADPANAGKGAIRLDGAMVERLHLAEAERIVAMADVA
jgi:citrate lyase subunit beta/citryl-CoA lyase